MKSNESPADSAAEATSGPGENSAPRWVGLNLPPIVEQHSARLRESPEVFQPSPRQSRASQIIGTTVLVVVVVGLLGSHGGVFPDHGPGRDPKPLRPTIVNALQTGGMIDGLLKTTTLGDTTIGMFALTMPDQQAATAVAQTIAATQIDGGLKADDNRALQGVTVMGSVPDSRPTAYRAVYVLYNRTIFVEAFGPDRDAVLATFDSVIKQQVTHAPPTVRGGH